MRIVLLLLLALLFAPVLADEPEFDFQVPASAADAGTAAAMRDLAVRILPVYQEADTERYLANLSALQLAAGNWAAANDTRQTLRERRGSDAPAQPVDRAVLFDLYAQAKAAQATTGVPFAQAFTKSFHDTVPGLNSRDAYAITAWLATPLPKFQAALQRAFDRLQGKQRIEQAEALQLVWTYLAFDAQRSFGAQVDALATEDEERRYITEDRVLIRRPGGVDVHVRWVRARSNTRPLPALFEFSTAVSPGDAAACAAHGYVGVVAYTALAASRSARKGHGQVTPFQRDGADARAVIQWIIRQPWSDGRVGMLGGNFGGFAAWSAARHLPHALKAIATIDAMAPGIDFPLEGGIFHNEAYRWALNEAQGQDATAADDAQWHALNQAWYRSGKPYRLLGDALGRLAKMRNPVFDQWLQHPSYDRHWQRMIPYQQQFARIDIAVLDISGYYARGQAASLYYLDQHLRYRPDADHTLLLGPYDEAALRRGPAFVVGGYPLDTAAQVDLRELRFQWFDHIFKNLPKPPLLSDRINYEVMGANQWQHAASLAGMANATLRFHLDAGKLAERPAPAQHQPADDAFLPQEINLTDRADAEAQPPRDLAGKGLDFPNALSFVSEPLQQPLQLDGVLTGQLDLWLNKMDLDLNLSLYEQLPDGSTLRLSTPYEFRASYAADRVHRHLLKAGERQQLSFSSEHLSSRQLQTGSRLVLVLGVNKRPDREINYGTGQNVSEESIADGKVPLKLRWYGGSFIDVPVRK